MKRPILILCAAAAGGLALARSAAAQNFFGGGVTAYDPEISTVQSGALMDAQVVVSDDRKYVTLNMQVQDSNLLALHNFEIASNPAPVGGGFVGALNPTGGTTTGAGGTTGGTGGGSGSGSGVGAGAGSPGAGGAGAVSPALAKAAAAPAGGLPPTNSPEELNRRGIAARSILNRRGMFLLAHS